MNETSKLVVVIGSVREGRFGPVVAEWVADRARDHGAFEVDVVDLADSEIPSRSPRSRPRPRAPATRARPGWSTSPPGSTPPTRSSS